MYIKKWIIRISILYLTITMTSFSAAFSEGLFPINLETGSGFIDSTGQVIIQPIYQSVTCFFSEKYSIVGIGSEYADSFGVIDSTGNFILEPRYSYIAPDPSVSFMKSEKPGILYVYDDMNKVGFLNLQNGFFSGCLYESIRLQTDSPFLYAVAAGSQNAGYIRIEDGSLAFPFAYDVYKSTPFENQWAWMSMTGNTDGNWIKEDGSVFVIPAGYTLISSPQNNYPVPVRDDATGYQGYCSPNGTIIKPEYFYVSDYSNGYAIVETKAHDWCLLNETGDILLTLPSGFSYQIWRNRIIAQNEQSIRLLNFSGKVLFSSEFQGTIIESGNSPILILHDNKTMYQEDGEELYHICFLYEDGAVLIPFEDNYFLDESLLEMYDYGIFSPFIDGFQCVYHDGRCGYIDMNKNVVIPFLYDYGDPCENQELAYVLLDGIGHYINRSGEIIW